MPYSEKDRKKIKYLYVHGNNASKIWNDHFPDHSLWWLQKIIRMMKENGEIDYDTIRPTKRRKLEISLTDSKVLENNENNDWTENSLKKSMNLKKILDPSMYKSKFYKQNKVLKHQEKKIKRKHDRNLYTENVFSNKNVQHERKIKNVQENTKTVGKENEFLNKKKKLDHDTVKKFNDNKDPAGQEHSAQLPNEVINLIQHCVHHGVSYQDIYLCYSDELQGMTEDGLRILCAQYKNKKVEKKSKFTVQNSISHDEKSHEESFFSSPNTKLNDEGTKNKIRTKGENLDIQNIQRK